MCEKHGTCHFLGHCYWQPPTQTKYISLAYYLTYIFTLYHVFWNLYPSPICIMDIIPLWCCHTTAILWHFVVFVIEWNKFVTFFLHIIVIRNPSPIKNTRVWNFWKCISIDYFWPNRLNLNDFDTFIAWPKDPWIHLIFYRKISWDLR